MKKYIISGLIILFIIILLLTNSSSISKINIKNINTLSKTEYSIVYFGEENEDTSDYLKSFKDLGDISVYYGETSLDELNDILDSEDLNTESTNVYVLFLSGLPVRVINNDLSLSEYDKEINRVFFDKIPDDEIKYIDDISADTYIKKVNDKDYVITVFGKKDCSYCTKYLPIVNKVATDYNLDIYYIDKDTYDTDEYNKIMNLDLSIPASCTTNNVDTSFLKGFPKPMTIITKSGEVVGCIKGYEKEEVLINKLKEFDLIEEEN